MSVKVNLRELIGRWENDVGAGGRLSYRRLSEATGIHKDTLSRLARGEVKRLGLDDLEALCRFFQCQPGDLLVYVPEEDA